jgi:hypothetical protein
MRRRTARPFHQCQHVSQRNKVMIHSQRRSAHALALFAHAQSSNLKNLFIQRHRETDDSDDSDDSGGWGKNSFTNLKKIWFYRNLLNLWTSFVLQKHEATFGTSPWVATVKQLLAAASASGPELDEPCQDPNQKCRKSTWKYAWNTWNRWKIGENRWKFGENRWKIGENRWKIGDNISDISDKSQHDKNEDNFPKSKNKYNWLLHILEVSCLWRSSWNMSSDLHWHFCSPAELRTADRCLPWTSMTSWGWRKFASWKAVISGNFVA